MAAHLPRHLTAACAGLPDGPAWLARLPGAIAGLARRWSLTLERPLEGDDVSCSWIAPARRADGTRAVLKLGVPHMEAEHEIEGLRIWNGDPTVRLLEADDELGAMLLERCEPGDRLRTLPEADQDVVIAGLLRRLWRRPPATPSFRPLAAMLARWADEACRERSRWADAGLVADGLRLWDTLSKPGPADVLLATDLHAGNVLRAEREPWLVIDPKPFVGDRAYDATQHLFNGRARLLADPRGTIGSFAGRLQVDAERVRLWVFARAAVAARTGPDGEQMTALARALAP